MQLIARLALVWAVLGGFLVLAIVGVTAANAGAFALDRIARLWGANVGALPGYEDFVRLAIGAAIPMFLPYCQLRRGHLAVDLFLSGLPRFNRLMSRVSLALMAGIALFLAYWMWLGMLESRADGALSRVLGWPEWPFYLTGIASLVLWALVAVMQLSDPAASEPDPDAQLHG